MLFLMLMTGLFFFIHAPESEMRENGLSQGRLGSFQTWRFSHKGFGALFVQSLYCTLIMLYIPHPTLCTSQHAAFIYLSTQLHALRIVFYGSITV